MSSVKSPNPKERQICSAPFSQRVLHHALMNVCHPFFERVQIYDSYASRVGKGTYAAIARAQAFSQKYSWYLKLDFRKYFDSINHEMLQFQLGRMFKDKKLLEIFNKIIGSYHAIDGYGLPIGNLTSQYFANHYLTAADHFAKEHLRAPGYIRYMDDLVFFHNDKAALLKMENAFRAYAEESLRLALKPFALNRVRLGLPFLGYLVFPGQVLLSGRSRRRFVKKLREYLKKLADGDWDQSAFQRHVLPLIAFTEHANAQGFRKKILKEIG